MFFVKDLIVNNFFYFRNFSINSSMLSFNFICFKEFNMALDKVIIDWIAEYHVLVHNAIYIIALIVAFVCLAGCIRFGIAIYRRKKGIYPPATSQMGHH